MLVDNHGRTINYVRLAVTDRCNLRCQYCMPEEGIDYVDRKELLTYEETIRLVKILASEGVHKVRITGGEPFLRKDLMTCISRIRDIKGIQSIHLTTNGTLTQHLISDFDQAGIKSVNLSLDSLDPKRFHKITRRDELHKVMDTLHALIEYEIPTKINMVVMHRENLDDILPMIELTKHLPIDVRFLEEMPFNGSGDLDKDNSWNHADILNFIRQHHPAAKQLSTPPSSTSVNYQIPGYAGRFGIIASFTRSFCGSCNRLRVTPNGVIKTCLYDGGIFNVRDLMRQGASDLEIMTAIKSAISSKAKDGIEAERLRFGNSLSESMATIGG